MMKDNKVYLLHILERISRVELYLLDLDWEAFRRDIKTVDAVTRNIEVIGEAAQIYRKSFVGKPGTSRGEK